jgi:5-methylcytosine-specific restriction endonuclease McrA
MHFSSVRSHLKPYVIVARRRTTINHAFAAAIAPSDIYDASNVKNAMLEIGQDPEDLKCVYCELPAQTWDHVFATVKNSAFSGHGHRLGNLLPCCKPCNSAKGNKDWQVFLRARHPEVSGEHIGRIEQYLKKYAGDYCPPALSAEYQRMLEIRTEVMALLAEADTLAKVIREGAG